MQGTPRGQASGVTSPWNSWEKFLAAPKNYGRFFLGVKQEERNKAECLKVCPERTAEPALWSLLPSGLCLALGKKKKRIPPLHTSFFLEGRLILLTGRHLKVIGIFLVVGGGGRSRPGALQGQSCVFPLLLLPAKRGVDSPSFQAGWWRVLDVSLSSRSHPGANTKCSPFQGETEARGVRGCKHPTSSPLAGLLVDWGCLAGFTPGGNQGRGG